LLTLIILKLFSGSMLPLKVIFCFDEYLFCLILMTLCGCTRPTYTCIHLSCKKRVELGESKVKITEQTLTQFLLTEFDFFNFYFLLMMM
jgi:hypothetical protein